ncbi:Uncharacterized protein HZ326_20802 [Fusarium oxysporum f. sp. albedinis]|nr:Uncharacterized protein HZ326_20802 [Fusarium oxysporum f. sp. albedinis]
MNDKLTLRITPPATTLDAARKSNRIQAANLTVVSGVRSCDAFGESAWARPRSKGARRHRVPSEPKIAQHINAVIRFMLCMPCYTFSDTHLGRANHGH